MTSEEEQAYEDALDASDWQVPPYGREYRAGAAALGGLLGMAEAIRARRRKCPTCRCTISIMQAGCSCCADTDADVDYEPFI